MGIRHLHFEGRSYISIDEIAACYQIEVAEIETWVSENLLEATTEIGGTTALPLGCLDRVAELVRYTRLLGLSTDQILVLLDS